MTIHQNLKDLRRASGMTQEEVANRVGLTRQAISSYESGRTQPDLDMLVSLAEVYGADVSDILYGGGREQKKLRTVRRVAVAAFAIPLILLLGSSCLLLISHLAFPIEPGVVPREMMPLVQTHLAIAQAATIFQRLGNAAVRIGFLVLAVLLATLKRLPPFKQGVFYVLAFAVGAALCTAPFGLPDRTFGAASYLYDASGMFFSALLLLAYWVVLWLSKRWLKGK